MMIENFKKSLEIIFLFSQTNKPLEERENKLARKDSNVNIPRCEKLFVFYFERRSLMICMTLVSTSLSHKQSTSISGVTGAIGDGVLSAKDVDALFLSSEPSCIVEVTVPIKGNGDG